MNNYNGILGKWKKYGEGIIKQRDVVTARTKTEWSSDYKRRPGRITISGRRKIYLHNANGCPGQTKNGTAPDFAIVIITVVLYKTFTRRTY